MTSLDERTGQLHFDDLSIVLGPTTTLSELLGHADAPRFEPFVVNPPHRSFRWSTRLDGTPFGGVVFFEDERIGRLTLTIDDPAVIGTSWDDYDPGRARAAHDEWLRTRLGTGADWQQSSYPFGGVEYRYSWGEVGSFLHPQDSTASITITYRPA